MQQEITDYIVQAQKHGLSDFEIKQNLLNAGWEAGPVEEGFSFAKTAENRPPQNYRTEIPSALSPLQNPHSAQKPPGIQSANPGIAISEEHFALSAKPARSWGKAIALTAAIAILACAGGAYAYYVKVYNTPNRVWNKALLTQEQSVFKSAYSLTYSFKPQGSASSTPVSFGVSGAGYFDRQDLKNPKLSGNIVLSAKADPMNINFNLGYLILNKILYVDVSTIPQLKDFLGKQDVSWIKIDPDAIQKYASQNTPTSTYQNPFGPGGELTQETFAKWAKLVKPGTFLAKEELDGIKVYHLKNEIDSQAFASELVTSINQGLAKSGGRQKEMTAEQKSALTAIINKIQIREFDTWVGQSDYLVYKVHIAANAPSTEDLSGSSDLAFAPQTKNRDAQRLADIMHFRSALELYYKDNGSYPKGKDGAALAVPPAYLASWPAAPQPPDGTCTGYYNTYWYEPAQNGKDYKLTFCLGSDTGGYKAGIGALSKTGITANIKCPSSEPANCAASPVAPEAANIPAKIGKLKFNAAINLDIFYSDFGKTENLPAPVNPADLLELIKAAAGKTAKP